MMLRGFFFTRLKHYAFGCSLFAVLSWDLRHQSVFLIYEDLFVMVHSKELKISSEITVEIRLILYTLGLRLYVVPFAIKVFCAAKMSC